jgi:hypothetical protein
MGLKSSRSPALHPSHSFTPTADAPTHLTPVLKHVYRSRLHGDTVSHCMAWVVGCSSFVAAVERTSMLRSIPIVVVLAVVAALSL